MCTKTSNSTSLALWAFTYVLLILLASISCLDFQFESEYEDINGIYLEHVQSYPFSGRKLLFNGEVGYIINAESLLIYDFTNVDSVILLNTFETSGIISDFLIKDGYAFLALPNRMEIIDLNGNSPNLISSLQASADNIAISGNHIYGYYGRWLEIINISDIAHPVQSGVYEFDEDIRHLEADSNYLHVLLIDGVFHLLSLVTPTEPFVAYTLSPNDTLHYLSFTNNDNYIYLTSYYRIVTYQITVNSDLVTVATLDSPASFILLSINDNHCVGFSLSTAIFFLNLEYPFQPCISEFIYVNAQPRQALIHGNYIFVLTIATSLEIIEIKQIE